jgi:hypothetical protein
MRFKILGGEPTLHSELIEYVELVAKLWPYAYRTLTTNGHFLDKYETRLPEVLARTNTNLYLTIHYSDPDYLRRIVPIARKWSTLSRESCFPFEAGEGRFRWYKTYLGAGKQMMPYQENNPRRSWEVCISKYCSQLHENRLWKCPCLAYLNLITDKLELYKKKEWIPYLHYNGIGLHSKEKELFDFINREEECYCTMCPTELVEIDKLML